MLPSRRLVAVLLFALLATAGHAQSLRPSRYSLDVQNREARRHDFTFLKDGHQVQQFVEAGYLVPLRGNGSYIVKDGVSYPYARPEVLEFVELLGIRYQDMCGEQLVVTSLTRPRNRQPYNASSRSVHPTGMALDLRRSWRSSCRRYLEQALLRLEAAGVVEAAYERTPPHYHVALFPRGFVQKGRDLLLNTSETDYFVVRGDTLWKIAQRHGTSVQAVKQVNNLRSNAIYPGQHLRLPSLP